MNSSKAPRIAITDIDQAPVESQPMLNSINQRIGFVPNVLKLLSLSPNTLTGFLALQSSLGKTLDLRTRNGIALAVSEKNGCHYCVSAHTYYASKGANTSDEEIALNRQGKSGDVKIGAAAKFGAKVVETRGHIQDADLQELRDAGYTDAQVVEIIALSAQFMLTNFMNNVANIAIDFPIVEPPVLTKHFE